MATPALTSPEISALLARISGRFLRFMRLPEGCSGALLIGLLSGSPGGAAALAACPRMERDSSSAFLRASIIFSGASPAFLLSGVATGMLKSPEYGWLLIRSQTAASLLSVLIFLSPPEKYHVTPLPPASIQPFRSAAIQTSRALLTIACYMVCFSAAAKLLSVFLGSSLETPILAVFELVGGCQALSSLSMPLSRRLPLISAAASFGGLSVFMQSMSFLSPLGISYIEYGAGKIVHAALSALLTYLQIIRPFYIADSMFVSVLLLTVVLLALFIFSLSRKKRVPGSESNS